VIELNKVDIRDRSAGECTIKVNDQVIEHVSGYSLKRTAGSLTEVTFTILCTDVVIVHEQKE
jgi:hypothetical protein